MSINSFRGLLYGLAKNLGHIQAGQQAARTGSMAPIGKRIGRVYAGKAASKIIGSIFR